MAKPRLIFLGNERLATATTTSAPVLQALVRAGYKIEAVIASHQDPLSRQKRNLEIGSVAQSYGIPVILPGKIQLQEKLKKHPADAAILVAFGQLIPQSVIDYFPLGIINLHPSLLPELRGSTPVETAILEGLGDTGVSLMQLSAEMDSGPIYAQKSIKLSGKETKQQLANALAETGKDLLLKHLPAILSGKLIAKPQDESRATFCQKISKPDGKLDFSKPAIQLEREIRAYAGWPGSHTEIWGKDVIITKAHSTPGTPPDKKPGDIQVLKDNDILMIYSSNGYICIDTLKPAGKNEMSAAEFIRGYKP